MLPQATQQPHPALEAAFRNARQKFGYLVIFSIIINILMFTGPLYMLQIYDRVVSSRSDTTLLVISIGAGILLVIYGIMDAIRSWLLSRYSRRFINNLADDLFESAFQYASKTKNSSQTMAVRDMDTIRDFIAGATLGALCDIPWVPIYIAACFWVHPTMGYFAIGAVIVVLCIATINQFLLQKPQTNAGNALIGASSSINDSMRNAPIIKALGMGKQIEKRWHESMRKMWGWQSVSSDRSAVVNSMSKSLRFFFQSAIMGLGAYLAVVGTISPGLMIAGSIILGRAL
ncbi:MAG: ABC transporter transmembrane domain-containing protein, partial [Pseudomonadota bacterium]